MDIASIRSRIPCAVGVSVEIASMLWTFDSQNPGETEADVRKRVEERVGGMKFVRAMRERRGFRVGDPLGYVLDAAPYAQRVRYAPLGAWSRGDVSVGRIDEDYSV